ncbi:hypothetical protein GGX14DRAFT_625775 [Mycena pura]|uniref:Uncharacterized protein n=1 Tax=Mycena pura TaxID=153505 RepID=A0AAD6YAP0_9AGAR|nr:hypothetical protein GGX14DRAFT_625775 [Mycena pura]
MPAPKKKKSNISGLRNQGSNRSSPAVSAPSSAPSTAPQTPDQSDSENATDDEEQYTILYSLRNNWEAEEKAATDSDVDSELGSDVDWDMDEEEGLESMKALALKVNPSDHGEWLPPKQARVNQQKRERPKVYIKGPDVMSKSARTRRRYKESMKTQTTLDDFRFTSSAGSSRAPSLVPSRPRSPSVQIIDMDIPATTLQEEPLIPRRRRASASPEQSSGSDAETTLIDPIERAEVLAAEAAIEAEVENLVVSDNDLEAWEQELDENVAGPQGTKRSWSELREKIQMDIKKGQKTLPLSRLNALMVLLNFSTLLTKGYGRIEASRLVATSWHKKEGVWFTRRIGDWARHYEIFETLPAERRGGKRVRRSFLHRDEIRTAVLTFLRSLPSGKVTPRVLANQLNKTILPAAGIQNTHSISLRTARRWLHKLGWTYSQVKKGVYVDGHEREDVVQYRNEVFLPKMAEYQRRMAKYIEVKGEEVLKRIEPTLGPGETELIPLFHDESYCKCLG